MAKQPNKPKTKPMVKPTVSKIKKPKTVKPTWSSKPKKPKSPVPKADDGEEKKLIVRSTDGAWWADLGRTQADHPPEWYVEKGWMITSDAPVLSEQYPEIDRRVELTNLLPKLPY